MQLLVVLLVLGLRPGSKVGLGALQVQAASLAANRLFSWPGGLGPDLGALASRLRARGQDDEAEIGRRMEAARAESAHWPEFDHLVINETLDVAIAEARAVLVAARLATARQVVRAAAITGTALPGQTGRSST